MVWYLSLRQLIGVESMTLRLQLARSGVESGLLLETLKSRVSCSILPGCERSMVLRSLSWMTLI
jgi:hypothetical protein